MVSKYIALLTLLFIVNTSRGQESMQESILPNISDLYIEKLVATAKEHYPKARTFESRVNIAHSNIQKAKLDWFNILTFNYIWSPPQANTSTSSSVVVTGSGQSYLNGYSFGVSTNFGNLLQKPTMVKIAREEYNIAQMNQEEYMLNIAAIVKQRYYVYVQQMSNLNWKTKAVESADRIAKESKYKFEKGEETFDVYNNTYLSYSNAVQAKMEAETNYLIAKSSLEEILGIKLEEIK